MPDTSSATDQYQEQQLGNLQSALDNGLLQDARKIHNQLRRRPLDTCYRKQFRALTLRLSELQDWQVYATLPKRETLCEEMRNLVDSDLPASLKAKKIKALHKSWQDLGPSNSRDAQRLWIQFKSAGDSAYKDCQRHFEAQHQQRERNAEMREQICIELEQLNRETDWATVDYRKIASTISRAHKNWHRHCDVPRRASKPLGVRFRQAITPIQTLVDTEQQKNHDLKQEIITCLKKRLSEDDLGEDLIDFTKQLQHEWRNVGITRRDMDQKLWGTFRALCDEVFRHRDRETHRKEIQNGQQKNKVDAIHSEMLRKARLCDQIEEEQLTTEEAQTRWGGDIELPAELEDALRRRFEVADQVTDEETLAYAESVCAEVEILAGIETPGTEALRMQIQIERLKLHIEGSQDNDSPLTKLRKLQQTFLCIPLGRSSSCLKSRFSQAEKAIRSEA